MSQTVFIIGYCLFCLAISAVVMIFLKTTWVYFLVSATLPAVLFVGGVAVWDGHLDAWSDIAFMVSWLIALGCSFVYYVTRRLGAKGKADPKDLET
jgi:hypothetical protein